MKEAIDVSLNFKVLINLFIITLVAGCFRDLIAIVVIKTGSRFFNNLNYYLTFIQIFHFALYILTHFYRLRHAGRVCSGDFIPADKLELESN